ncbi:MAG: helix-turn-helix domain-containing protein [Verrucomicrobia bacterium]|nr:helix-turn-helix domain-containing protein [Verrucomicrobiota bacterium]
MKRRAEQYGGSGLAVQMARLRESRGLTQKDLAKFIGTSQQQISRIESPAYAGHSLSMLRRVADALGAEISIAFEPAASPVKVRERHAKYRAGTRRPAVTVVAGPNGAGKSTFAMTYLPSVAKHAEFVNADSIARGLSPLNEAGAAIQAGRLFLKRMDELVRMDKNFALESTLSGLTLAYFLQDLKRDGYRINFCYLWIPSADFSAKRVAERVAAGGHDIPLGDIKRRYGKSLGNLLRVYAPIADSVVVWNNSGPVPQLIYERTTSDESIADAVCWRRIRKQGEML